MVDLYVFINSYAIFVHTLRFDSLELKQSYNLPGASEVTHEDIGKINRY